MQPPESPDRTDAPPEGVIADPFAWAPDADAYVERDATRAALEKLVRSVRDPDHSTVLVGPDGLGKTLLLHRLARELRGEMRAVYLPVAALTPAELCDWVLRLLGSPPTEDPVAVLWAYARHLRSENSALLVLVDDGAALPRATAERIGQLVAGSAGSLRWVVVGSEAPGWRGVQAALGDRIDVVRFDAPMSRAETRAYIDGRLELARVPQATRDRFSEAVVDGLHAQSGGIPGRLHEACAEVLRTRPPAADDAAADGRERRTGGRTFSLDHDPVLSDLVERATRTGRGSAGRRRDDAGDSGRTPLDDDDDREGIRELRALALRPPENRVVAPPSRRGVILGAVGIAAITLVIPIILSQLRELSAPPELARVERPRVVAPVAPRSPGADPAASGADSAVGPISVNVNADPWAEIRVDGLDVGQTPLANVPLLAGSHVFRAELPDGSVIEREVSIDARNRFVVFP